MPAAMKTLPGPRPLPGLGNALALRPDRVHLVLEGWADRHGPLYRAAVGRRPWIVVADPATIDALLRDRPAGMRRASGIARAMTEMGIDGVFNAEGTEWRRHRRLTVTALNADHLHRFYSVIETCCTRLHARIAAAGDRLDAHALCRAFTVDVTSSLAFGQDIDTLGSGDARLAGHVDRMFAMTSRRASSLVPYWRWFKLPADRALDRSLAELDAAVAGFVEAARRRRAADPDRPPDTFLDSMLAAPERYSEKDIASNVLTVLAGGEDTTSHTLAWALWHLAGRPDLQERLAADAGAALDGGSVPTYEAARGLPYAEAVVRETLRLRSPAPVVFLETLRETEIGGVSVPAGVEVLLLTRYAGLRPREFAPDRWLGDDAPGRAASAAFGGGPRFCPGRNLAFLEAKAALATIAGAFRWSPDPAAPPPEEHFGFTMGPTAVRLQVRAA